MKINKKIVITLFFAIIWMVLNNVSFAGTQKWKSLDYQAELNSDGSMDVVETWNIYMSETNTIFKDFDLDDEKFSNITNVRVTDLSSGMNLTEIDEEMYHVTKDCYYGLPISDSQFEIAWGVGLDDSSDTRKYQISYTVEDVVTVYDDCSELYWQFLGTDNTIKADKITGTIRLPQKVDSLEKFRVWAHGPLNGEIYKTSEDTVSFEVSDFSSKTMLEVRVIVEDDMFYNSMKRVNSNKLEDIIEEETVWADEANSQRRQAKLVYWMMNIAIGIIFIFFLFKIKKYLRELKQVKAEHRQIDIGEYFRDIPREKEVTPVEAAFLYYSKKNNFYIGSNISKVFSATLLQLCLKGYISFDCENAKDIKINLLNNLKDADGKVREQLKPSESSILEFLHKMAKEPYASLSMSEIKKYAKKNYDQFDSTMSGLTMRGRLSNIDCQNYDNDKASQASSYRAKASLYIITLVFMFIFFAAFLFMLLPKTVFAIAVEFIICAIILMKTANEVNVLTEQGEIERAQWKGLKKYMEDFSMLKEREILDLVLWEKYLIYATAFGISDKVIKQLQLVYPQMQNLDSNAYAYLYLMSDTRFSNGFVNEFNNEINRVYTSYRNAYNTAHSSSSSGSGGGGGFSGGGGGRRWRWPDAEADNFDRNWRNNMKIGIDIGGSHIGIGLIESEKIVASKEKNFNCEERKNMEKTILDSIQKMIEELLREYNLAIEEIELIGIAAPGTIANGIIVSAGNLNLKNFEIVSALQKKYTIPIQIRNDAKCAALAEKAFGSMKDYDDCVFLTIGTGIGGAAFLGGELLEPKRYAGFEFGHMILNRGGRVCSCGKQGCFEAYSSIKALKNKVTETLGVDNDISGQYLREELIANNRKAVAENVEEFLEYLKIGIGNLIEIFEPEIVCLGGSFSYYRDNPIFDELLKKMQESGVRHRHLESLPSIVIAKFKNDAGIIGSVI